jgi:SAM-dependent methyltransferase
VGSIHRLLTEERLERLSARVEQYRAVRARDGHGRRSIQEYRALPHVARSDPNWIEWRIRCESFASLRRTLTGRSLGVLDLGAGNGWLSNRVMSDGHRPVAVDLNVDVDDGLGACSAYESPFPLVQADFDELPFAPGQFDVVVFNASLHYAPDPARTLAGADRMVAHDGALIVMDSPMFERHADGEAMAAQQRDRLQRQLGVPPERAGAGFLVFDALDAAARRLGRRVQFVPSRGPIRWRLGRMRTRRRLNRAPAGFGMWVAR